MSENNNWFDYIRNSAYFMTVEESTKNDMETYFETATNCCVSEFLKLVVRYYVYSRNSLSNSDLKLDSFDPALFTCHLQDNLSNTLFNQNGIAEYKIDKSNWSTSDFDVTPFLDYDWLDIPLNKIGVINTGVCVPYVPDAPDWAWWIDRTPRVRDSFFCGKDVKTNVEVYLKQAQRKVYFYIGWDGEKPYLIFPTRLGNIFINRSEKSKDRMMMDIPVHLRTDFLNICHGARDIDFSKPVTTLLLRTFLPINRNLPPFLEYTETLMTDRTVHLNSNGRRLNYESGWLKQAMIDEFYN